MKKINLFTMLALAAFLLGAMVLINGCNKDRDDLQFSKSIGKTGDSKLKADPTGYFDRLNYNNSGLCEGWAYDPEVPSSSISVHIYMDGPAGAGGIFIGYAPA